MRFARIAVRGCVAAAVVAAGVAFADDSGKALFEEKCRICHELERPLGQRKSRAEWAATVTRMKETNGCPITDEQAARIVDHLAEVRGPLPKE